MAERSSAWPAKAPPIETALVPFSPNVMPAANALPPIKSDSATSDPTTLRTISPPKLKRPEVIPYRRPRRETESGHQAEGLARAGGGFAVDALAVTVHAARVAVRFQPAGASIAARSD